MCMHAYTRRSIYAVNVCVPDSDSLWHQGNEGVCDTLVWNYVRINCSINGTLTSKFCGTDLGILLETS